GAFFQDAGVDGLLDLSRAVARPELLGQAIVESDIPEAARAEILVRALKSDWEKHHDLAIGMVSMWVFVAGREWAEQLFDRAQQEEWGERDVLIIVLALPPVGWVWALAQRAGLATEKAYWRKVNVLWSRDDDSDPAYAVERLIEAGRARESVHLIGYHLHIGT